MADKFYNLAQQKQQDRVVKREQRIYADTLFIPNGATNTIKTTSTAPRQKIKFFLDVIRLHDDTTDPVTDRYYRVGKYFEVEHNETIQHFFSLGWVWFTYTCTENDGTGSFDFSFSCNDPRYSLYISNVNFEDSFYNSTTGWLNPSNPNNLLALLQTEEMKREKMNFNYCLLSFRNMDTVTHPIYTYYKIHEDDFLKVGYYKAAPQTTQLFFIPQNFQAIKPLDDRINPNFEYSGSGAYNADLPAAFGNIPLAAPTVQQINEPIDLKTKYTNPAGTTGLMIPEGYGFDITLPTIATRGRITWDANDGYTYGLEFYGNVYSVNTNAAADFNLLYLGRNPTGYNPIKER